MKTLLTTLMLVSAFVARAQTVTLAWDASPSTNVAGYRVHYGTNAGVYPLVTNVGLVLTQTVVLPRNGRWFFTVTAVDRIGIESIYSNEVQWEAKPAAPVVRSQTWVRLSPVIEWSTNVLDWRAFAGEATWLPATNNMMLFATRRLLIEQVQRVNAQ